MSLDNQWRKSTRSAQGDCVEVRLGATTSTVEVRDSKDPQGPELTFTPTEWSAFIAGVGNGEFDLA